jgi:hypothetical protein
MSLTVTTQVAVAGGLERGEQRWTLNHHGPTSVHFDGV